MLIGLIAQAQHKNLGGPGLIDLEGALVALFCKWVLVAMEPKDSNFKLFLHFKLECCKPSPHIS